MVRGRAFNDRDDGAGARVAIINEALARQFWPKGDPLGERLILGKGYGPEFEEPAREIVGIVGDVHNFGLGADPPPVVYVPFAQITDGLTALASRASRLVWMVRTQSNPAQLSSAIQNQLQQASGGLPLASIRTMDEVVSQSTATEDFNALLMSIFGCTALLLAAIGIYGLMAYSVAQRTQEIGIRLALGAEMSNVRNMVIAQGMRLAAIGIAIGIASSSALRGSSRISFRRKTLGSAGLHAGSRDPGRRRTVRRLDPGAPRHAHRSNHRAAMRVRWSYPRGSSTLPS